MFMKYCEREGVGNNISVNWFAATLNNVFWKAPIDMSDSLE